MLPHGSDVQSVVSNCVRGIAPPLKLLVCQVDAVVVQDAAELVLLDVSFSVVVKQPQRSDHGRQVASDLWGSHTMTDSNSSTAPRRRLWTPEPDRLVGLRSPELSSLWTWLLTRLPWSVEARAHSQESWQLMRCKEEMQRSLVDTWNREEERGQRGGFWVSKANTDRLIV